MSPIFLLFFQCNEAITCLYHCSIPIRFEHYAIYIVVIKLAHRLQCEQAFLDSLTSSIEILSWMIVIIEMADELGLQPYWIFSNLFHSYYFYNPLRGYKENTI